jgi:ABC-2 type transport system permease protein
VKAFDRISAIAAKEFIHIRRDPRTLISVLIMPVFQLLLFAYAISFDVRDVPAVVLDADRTMASREFVSAFSNSDFFRVVGHVGTYGEVDRAFDTNEARVAIVVKAGYGQSVLRGQKGQATILVDGSEPNSAQLGQNYAIALSQRLDRSMLLSWASRQGIDTSSLGQAVPVVRTWYNPQRRSADFLIPGLMVVIVMIVTVQQTAVTLVREKDEGTLEQLLVSPIRRGELMVGKVAPWVFLAFVDMLVITGVALAVFHVPVRGDVLVLALGTFLFVLCCLSLGLLISARASSPEVANFASLMVSFLPGFMLSGMAFPLNSIPKALQFISYVFPARYMVVIARGVFLKGAGLPILWPQVVLLAVYAVVSLTLASVAYSRRI